MLAIDHQSKDCMVYNYTLNKKENETIYKDLKKFLPYIIKPEIKSIKIWQSAATLAATTLHVKKGKTTIETTILLEPMNS
jgi:hypothetical protein